MDKIESTFPEKYGVNNIKQLVDEIRAVGKELERLQGESQSQQEQDQLQQIGQQDAAREEYMEKSSKTIEATQDYIDKLKKTMELIEQGKYYKTQEIEAQKAFEVIQQANYELYQSYQRLMEVMGEKLPTHQQDANILSREIQEGFGAKKVDEIITFAERFKLKVEEIEAEVKEQPQAQEKQKVKNRGRTYEP